MGGEIGLGSSLAARLITICDQPGTSATTTENHVAKPPLYAMLLVSIDCGESPLFISMFQIVLRQKLIQLLRSPIYHVIYLGHLLAEPIWRSAAVSYFNCGHHQSHPSSTPHYPLLLSGVKFSEFYEGVGMFKEE